ncbi:MAG: phosphoribosylamine--glycine ligase [Myxococcaceae bacterium]|nr:phosphoribosylamine--glycine ligase [Myxococcaceae bacterium]
MKVLVLGSGAREHALAWKLSQSEQLQALTVAPGNGAIATRFATEDVELTAPAQVVALARKLEVDLVVVGPEAPLVAGAADALRAAGIAVFGPDQAAARIEGSKAFAKDVMAAAQVPTARTEVFDDPAKAKARLASFGPVVVKADGLAQGKGVVVASSEEEAAQAIDTLASTGAGTRLLLEERLLGREVSVMALCDGERYALLPASQDFKRLLDGDRGPNTGGMGAWSAAELLPPGELEALGAQAIAPVLAELSRRGCPFRGALYAGLMLTPQGPRVLEYNCRLGDPETQVLMLQLGEDLLPHLDAAARGRLRPGPLAVRPGASVGVVLASPGYPERPSLGGRLAVTPPAEGELFFAGVGRVSGQLVAQGGRVLTAAAWGPTVARARALAYRAVQGVQLEGAQVRQDIAARERL